MYKEMLFLGQVQENLDSKVLQPLCGIGVTSLILLNSRPAVWRALIAASLPEPGPLTYTSTVFKPCSIAAFAAVSAASPAANGVDFLVRN